MAVKVDVPRPEDEAPAELKRVPARAVLAVARRAGPGPGARVVPPEEVQERGSPEARGAVRLSPLVDQEREPEAGLLAEAPRVLAVAEADGGEARATLPESLLVRAQLRDVLPAEDSAVVAEEEDHRRAVRPQ